MLLQRESEITQAAPSFAGLAPQDRPVRAIAQGPFQPSGRYGERRGLNMPGLAIALGVQALAIPLILSLGAGVFRQKEAPHVVAVNLTPAASAAPSHEPEKKAPAQRLDTAPKPVVQPQPVLPAPPVARLTLAAATVSAAPVVRVDAPPPAAPAASVSAAASGATSAPGPVGMGSANLNGIRMIAGDPPRYPLESRRLKEQGTVRLRVLLGTDGRVKTIEVSSSSGFERLDKAALSAVRHWRWSPVVRDGQPVEVPGFLDIPFVLRGA